MSSNQRSSDLLSPNLARYLTNGGVQQHRPGRIVQQRVSNIKKDATHTQNVSKNQPRANTKKKHTIAKKNLVIMYPSKHLNNRSLDRTDDSINISQLLFSPTATEGQLHSIFSPPVNNKVLRDVGTEVDFLFSPISHNGGHEELVSKPMKKNERYGKEDEVGFFEVALTDAVVSEKENMPPVQQHLPSAEKRHLKTPARTPKNMDDSSVDSLDEFYTPCPKTPGTKSFQRQEMEEISYQSLNTTRESREHLLSSFSNHEEIQEGRWEENDWKEEDENKLVFVTPKQCQDRRNEDDSSGDGEFFSPLAQYTSSNPPNDNEGDEGSSINLLNEAKGLLTTQHRHSIEDEGEEEFFSPLAQHHPSSYGQPFPYEDGEFDRFSPIPVNDKAANQVYDPLEEGSTYCAINDARILISRPVELKEPVAQHLAEAKPTEPTKNVNEGPSSLIDKQPDTFVEKDSSAFFQLTPSPEAEHAHTMQLSPSYSNNKTPDTTQTQITTHPLHSPLPPGALTVDFVRKCNCIVTLKAILEVLSGSTRGKQLRQPRLVQFVQNRLAKLAHIKNDASVTSSNSVEDRELAQENDWQHFERENEWNLKLPPRITSVRKGGKSIAWSEDVKDNAEHSLASISVQSSLSLQSANDIATSSHVLNTPKVVQVTGLPVPTSSPSIHLSSIAESSLDMNLSESFTLGDESAYWKMSVDNIPEEADAEVPTRMRSQLEEELTRELDEIHKKYEEAKADIKRLNGLLKNNEKQKVCYVKSHWWLLLL